MAIKSIHLTNFRCFSEKTFEFKPDFNCISGPNGIGKTTIREAICFGFIGSDSVGSKNSTHLIQEGKSYNRVTITTDKAIIQRGVDNKNTSYVTLTREDVTTKMTKAEFEKMLGSSDLFLSILVPEYFIKLAEEKKQKVLSEVLPEVDRYQLLEDMVGFHLTTAEIDKYNLSKRSDLVCNVISTDRRACDRATARLEGQITVLQSVLPLPEPKKPVGIENLEALKLVVIEWDRYNNNIKNWKYLERQRNRQIEDNEVNSEEAKEIQKALETFKNNPSAIAQVDNSEKIKVVIAQMRNTPERPIAARITDMEVCNSCGQIVGAKHRERIRDENERLLQEYDSETQSVNEFNKPLALQISNLEEEEALSMGAVRKIRNQKERLLLKLQEFKVVQVMELSDKPEEPQQSIDRDEAARLENIQDTYKAKLTEYNYSKSRRDKAKLELADYNIKIGKINQTVKRLSILEAAVKELPVRELRKQAEALEMPTVELRMNKRISIFKNGVPYELLSTGNGMRACLEICIMLNSLAKRAPNLIFLDDADLVDNLKFDHTGIQFFVTNVTNKKELTIGGK